MLASVATRKLSKTKPLVVPESIDPSVLRCKSCGVPVTQAYTETGTPVLMDAQPSPVGDIWLETKPDGSVLATIMLSSSSRRAKPEHGPGALFKCHYATCARYNSDRL